jgi:hypothetical protein
MAVLVFSSTGCAIRRAFSHGSAAPPAAPSSTGPAPFPSARQSRPEAARVSARVRIFSSSGCSLGPTAPTESPFSCFDSGRVHPNPFFQQDYAFTVLVFRCDYQSSRGVQLAHQGVLYHDCNNGGRTWLGIHPHSLRFALALRSTAICRPNSDLNCYSFANESPVKSRAFNLVRQS